MTVWTNREQVLEALAAAGKPLHAGALAKVCGIPKNEFRAFAAGLEELANDGSVTRAEGNRYRLPKRPRGARWQGILSVNPRGFGFVNAAGKSDVFIGPEALGPALHGDTVEVEIVEQGPRGPEGRIVGVVSRRNRRVPGTVHRRRKSAWLDPDDARLRGPIVLLDGNTTTEDGACAEDGEAAVAEITRFPESASENPEGVLVAVLGKPGEARVEVEKIKIREQIEEAHPPPAIAEAEAVARAARKLTLGTRRDLRNVHLLTIDPKDARDHDDAVYAERMEDGFRVYVAIADVSEYVTEKSALDAEALTRGCTIYLPDRAIPMLPGSLAADLCSLLPEQERYCLCVVAELDAQARVRRFEVVEGLMRAAAMITYDSAARTLGFTEEPPLSPQAEAFKRDLKTLATVAAKLRGARMQRGALDFTLPEPRVDLADDGSVVNVTRRAQDPGIKRAYQIVEEMMLLANELVAQWLIERQVPTMYRVHGRPDEAKLSRLAEVAELLGVGFDLDEVSTPKGLSLWLRKIAKHEKSGVLESLVLRSLKQASYDAVNIGHFGLASEAYLHFTSPIRRYPDLLVHRLVKQVLRGKRPVESPAAIEALRTAATQSSARERAAMSVEREVVDLYRALLGRRLLGEIFEGKVSALVGGGVFVSVDNPFIEVMIPYEGMGPDRYELSQDELSFVGARSGDTLSLGDTLSVEIVDSSILRRMIYGRRIVHFSENSGERRAPRRGRGGSTGRSGSQGRSDAQGRSDSQGRSGPRGQAQPRASGTEVRGNKRAAGSGEKSAARTDRFGKSSAVTPSRSKPKPKSKRGNK